MKGRRSPRSNEFQKIEVNDSDCSDAYVIDNKQYLIQDQNSHCIEEKDQNAEQDPFYSPILKEDSEVAGSAVQDSLFDIGFVLEALGQLSYYAAETPQLPTAHIDNDENSDHSVRLERNNVDDDQDAAERHKSEQIRKNLQSKRRSHQYTHTDMLSIAIILCPLWFLANCFYNYALLYTSVASSTVISNLSGGFTLFFSWLYGVEKITFSKILGLAICFFGVALVAMSDTKVDAPGAATMTGRSLLGDIMAVLGAAGYGLYTSVLRVKIADDECASMQLLLGYMGLVNALVLSPVLLLMVSHQSSVQLNLMFLTSSCEQSSMFDADLSCVIYRSLSNV